MKSTLAVSAVIFTLGFVSIPLVFSDTDRGWSLFGEHKHRSTDVAAIGDPVYKEECGSCHMAYPPGLLPSASWTRVMKRLEDHFGDNAELDTETHAHINDFLQANSADRSDYRRSRKFARYAEPDNPPMRISETPYFLHEHDEIPPRLVHPGAKVRSFAQCDACHAGAEQGSFNEHDIQIPGFGYWED